MGLNKKIFYAQPDRKPTKEEQKELDAMWDMLCKNGSVCVTDASYKGETVKEILRRNPDALLNAHCDYYDCDGETSYDEFCRQMMAGEHNEK